MGAIGVALLTEENMNGRRTNFRGEAILEGDYGTAITRCEDCENNCEVLQLLQGNKLLASFGSRCGKYNLACCEMLNHDIY
ncbi:hypothetical protein ES705_33139 [subsurface metagenome]